MLQFRPLSRGAIVAVSAIAIVSVAGAVVAATRDASRGTVVGAAAGSEGGPHPAAVVSIDGLKDDRVPWDKHLTLVITNGMLRTVDVTRPDGTALDGSITDNAGQWISATKLVPLTKYVANVSYSDQAGHDLTQTLQFRTTDSKKHLHATLTPGDGNVVGVGSPIVVYFSRSVPESKRALVESRLAVSTTPSVIGAWHWMNDQEVHWRPPAYWKRGTKVSVSADLNHLYVGSGVWGQGKHSTSFKIGDSHISRVDAAAHEMYVYDNGKLVKTFPISAGRDKYPTKSGVHITFEKSQVVTMDSATVGIPRNSPDGYYEKVYWDVRISYGGAFVHAAPWSVADQGVVNVSHGCVNISTDNAIWFYNFSLRGDIVDIVNTGAGPDISDPGMADWNMSWKKWVAGDAAPTAPALDAHPPMPRAVEPPHGPGYDPSTVGTTQPSASPTPTSPSPSPTPSPSTSPTATAAPTGTAANRQSRH